MTGAQVPHTGAPPPSERAPRPQWPSVIGTIGIILGVLIFIDKIDDLATLSWTAADWERIFAPDVAELIVRGTGPVGWNVFSSVVQMGLGVLLVVGSVALRRRRRTGVSLCRAWAWLAIVWAVTAMGWAAWRLTQYAGELPGLSFVSWQGWAVFGIVVALGLILAYPVFLLVWLSRREVQAEVETWAF